MTSKTKVLIIGAGIGGLATAVAMQQAGFEVMVYEATPVLREVGAGISLWANATAVLEKLRLLDEAIAKSSIFTIIKIKTEQGRLLMQSNLDKYPTPALCLHRADLINLLFKSCALETVFFGKSGLRFEQNQTNVTAFFADGTSASGDILIGADGINSRVRAEIKGDTKPVYRGYAAWRGVVEFDASDSDASDCPIETWGAGRRFGLVPIGKNRFYWYATNNQPENLILPPPKRKTQLLQFFDDWHYPIREIIDATDAENILHNDCYDRPPERNWSDGRVCLIGDAAHPTTPNLGQGGCMALEDAVVLTKCLQSSSSPKDAFRKFETERFARTKFISERSLLLGSIGQWHNPLALVLRNVLTKYTPQKSLEKDFERFYGSIVRTVFDKSKLILF